MHCINEASDSMLSHFFKQNAATVAGHRRRRHQCAGPVDPGGHAAADELRQVLLQHSMRQSAFTNHMPSCKYDEDKGTINMLIGT